MGQLIDFDGFEKYALPVAATLQGFAKGAANIYQTATTYTGGTSMEAEGWTFDNVGYAGILTGLLGTGKCLAMYGEGSGGDAHFRRFWPANYSRVLFGTSIAFGPSGGGNAQCGVIFLNTSGGVVAMAGLLVDSSGHLVVSSGGIGIGYSYIPLWVSSQVLLPYTRYYVEIDITFAEAGQFTVWLNGVNLGSGSGNTAPSRRTTPWASGHEIFCGNQTNPTAWDDQYWRDNQDGLSLPLGDATVDPMQAIANSAIQFTPVGNAQNYQNIDDVPAPWYESNGSVYNVASAPGQEDLYRLSALPEAPNAIYSVKVGALALRSTAGPRTISLHAKSNGVDGTGSLTAQTPPTGAPAWLSSRFDTDPSTNAPWNPALFYPNPLVTAGYSVAS